MTLTRSARSWWQLLFHVTLLLAGLGFLQLVAERTNRRFDLTPTRSLSLSGVTRHVLQQVKAPLRITAFYRRGERQQYADLLQRLAMANHQLQFELFDLDRYPDRATSLGISQYGRAAIEYEGRRTVAVALPEEQLVGGILKAVRGRSSRLVFTTGHGERAPAGGPDSYGRLSAALGAENYAIDVAALSDGAVPPDTDLLLVAGPKHDFLPLEVQAIADYLKAGGGVILLLDPGELPNVSRLLASMGVALRDDFVVDRERRVLGTDGLAAVVELFKTGNPISDPERNPIETGVVLPSARTVEVVGEVPGVDAESIARTAPTAWSVADPARARRGEEPSAAKHDVHGSASVVVMGEVGSGGGAGHPRGRLVVIGDADFASDAYLDLLGNRDLALNSVAWAANEDALAGTRAKKVPEVIRPLSPLVLTDRQARGILVGLAVVEPGIVLAAGVLVVAIARRRG